MSKTTPLKCRLLGHSWREVGVPDTYGFVKKERLECTRCGESDVIVYAEKVERPFGWDYY